jgi:hypothetical protein
VKFGIGCRHFSASMAIISGRYGNLCCSVVRSGRSVVMNEYISFWMLSSGFIICKLSEWNFCNKCGSVGRGLGLSIRFLISFVVHCVEFSAIKLLLSVGVGASVINIA